jgi:hypothetical protein
MNIVFRSIDIVLYTPPINLDHENEEIDDNSNDVSNVSNVNK